MASVGLNLPYHGPTALGSSRHAIENAGPITSASKPYGLSVLVARPENGAVATAEQLASSADLQLAFAQNEALKKEVDEHAATFTKSVNSAVANTRQLLQLLRENINVKQEDEAAKRQLTAVDELGEELERLYKTAQEAKKALPEFLEKQGDNMKLYHNSTLAETIAETQQELALQHKKIAIQSDLILEKQHAFSDYKARTDAQIKQVAELEKQVSRLTLENGLLKTELDQGHKNTLSLKSAQEDHATAAKQLQEAMQAALSAKNEMAAENEHLRASIANLRQRIQLANGLEVQVKEMRSKETVQKHLLDRASQAKAEFDALQQKYKQLSAEYSAIFTKSNEQAKVVDEIIKEKDAMAIALKEATNVKSLQDDCDKLRAQVKHLTTSLDEATAKVGALEKQIEEVKTTSQNEIDNYKGKITKLENELEELEIDHDNALADVSAYKKATAGMKAVQDENARLNAAVKELREKGVEPAPGAGGDLQEKVRSLEMELAQVKPMVSKANDWRSLAERSYAQYKEILPVYKEAESIRQASAAKDIQIAQLNEQLKKGGSTSNGATGGASADYWKKKYDNLLASLN